ncbi:MAG: CDP-archaeol synthase [Gemmatimonadales bacterium]
MSTGQSGPRAPDRCRRRRDRRVRADEHRAEKDGDDRSGLVYQLASAAFPLGIWLDVRRGSIPALGNTIFGWAAVAPSAWYLVAVFTLVTSPPRCSPGGWTEQPLAAAAMTLLIPLYCGALPSFALGIRYGIGPERHWAATWALFFPLAITWICDTAAMYVGKAVGGPKLAPVVSPGKTRSGAIGGVLGGILAAVVYNQVALRPMGFELSAVQAGTVGLLLSVVAQVGDLAESLFKREAGVKDSSHLIPGHGGVLDRLDSLYFVVPVAAMAYRYLGIL